MDVLIKFSEYFQYRRAKPDRSGISDKQIVSVIKNPVKQEFQDDGRIRLWGRVGEYYLRVVLLPDGETVHNAFYDRGFKR